MVIECAARSSPLLSVTGSNQGGQDRNLKNSFRNIPKNLRGKGQNSVAGSSPRDFQEGQDRNHDKWTKLCTSPFILDDGDDDDDTYDDDTDVDDDDDDHICICISIYICI